MKQIIPFVKDIDFNTKISEITSIALEHNLKLENNDSIVGTFDISGKYKINDVSVNEESFEKELNFDITLDDKYDKSKVIFDIDNFYYEIINDNILRVHIDVLANNLVYYREEKKEEIKQEETKEPYFEDISNDIKEEDLREDKKEDENMIMEESVLESRTEENKEAPEKEVREEENVKEERKGDFTASFIKTEEKYSTYKIHIIRENENIDTIKEKYGTTEEELSKYNNLDSVILGTKLIIPISNE